MGHPIDRNSRSYRATAFRAFTHSFPPRRHALLAALFLGALPAFAAAAGFNYWDPEDTAKAPKSLSATGLYANIKTGKLIDNAHPFEVNTPLWSDDAHKRRWVVLKTGRSIAFDEKDDYWGYPDSTVFVKQFALDSVPGDTTSRRLWETRLMVNKRVVTDSAAGTRMDKWFGFSYKWNEAQTDAKLVGFSDVNDSMRTYPEGRGKPVKMKKWVFPAGHCDRCHVSNASGELHSRSVLGFFTAQLNRPSSANATVNQLEDLFSKGVLKGTKPPDWTLSPRWRAIDDSAASVNVRARSYIAANCSGCHGRRGNANFAAEHCVLNYDYHLMNDSLFEFRHHSTGGYGTEDSLPRFYPRTDRDNNPNGLDSFEIRTELVVPGYPQKSAILARQTARNVAPGDFDPTRNQMPPLGTFEVNGPAVALLAKWIKTMPPMPAPGWEGTASLAGMNRASRAPTLQGRILRVSDASGTGAPVSMSGIDGRAVALRRQGTGVYAVPAEAPRGVYFIRVGGARFRVNLL
ncbi:MAG: gdhB [Fibrobacteres bacterium]|nr:gdhB [Fibrobacterota bacterium]